MTWTLSITGYNHDPEEEREIQRNARSLIERAQESGVVSEATFSGSYGQADLLEGEGDGEADDHA